LFGGGAVDVGVATVGDTILDRIGGGRCHWAVLSSDLGILWVILAYLHNFALGTLADYTSGLGDSILSPNGLFHLY